ncbi:MAG TPA: biotin--[acetyl-CoA-carboxylase] ligase [Verrucomicrobiae bacterium]|nr:biotin--[acetyl-CoA-carboxylase] ligase [Verrucomicrobiae bacterium]
MPANLDTKILAALRQAGEAGVSGAELANRLAVTRAAIWGRIEELRALGYDIDASPHHGYRLVGTPDLLHADDLLARLGKVKVIGRDIQVFEQTTSTNDVVEKLARDGVREGVVVFAESQTKGRGRLGRPWLSPPRQGLWFSILLRPNLRPQAATQLTVVGATALARAFRSFGNVRPNIKWPNDILIKGRKVAGILTELSADPDHVKHLILGIGIDVNITSTEFPPELRKIATSLKIETGEHWNRAELAARVLQELDRDYARVIEDRFPALADEWEEQCETIGRNVAIQMGERRVQGRAEALDDDGALLVRTQHGRLERVIGGDVTMEK